MASDKPRYRGIIKDGKMVLRPVSAAPAKTRYRAEFKDGVLHFEPTAPPPPGRLGDVENEVLRGLGNQERGGPVPLTYFPTVTSDPSDPRTAAAGYDPDTRTLRVEWGDGGRGYNYYEVDPQTWMEFQNRSATPSPGRFINDELNYHPYGPV